MKTLVGMLAAGLLVQGRPAQGAGPEVGQPAPALKLRTQDGKEEVDLAQLKGRPVVLIFGSYT